MAARGSIYLDYNATAPVKPAARQAVMRAMELGGNPSSVHGAGRAAHAMVEDARAELAALLNARDADIVFTSGGTEANNLAILGLIAGEGLDKIYYGAIEHPSVAEAALAAGVTAIEIPCLASGVIDADWLAAALAHDGETGVRALVCLMLANNETGVIQPVKEIAEAARAAGASVHTDAAQAVGKVEVDFADLGVDTLAVCGHKFGAPQGAGALVARAGVRLAKREFGGGQERGKRAGTENVAAIAGLGAAAAAARSDMADMARIAELRDHIEASVAEIAPEAVFFGRDAERLATTTCFGVRGFAAETQVMMLDLAGVAISSGAACSSGKVTPSRALAAMGADQALARASIRVSLGWASRAEEADGFIAAWREAYLRAGADKHAATG